MRSVLSCAVLALLVVCTTGTLRAAEECKDGCPIVSAARDAGASKEGVTKITQLRNELLAAFTKLQQSSEYQQANRELAAAKKRSGNSDGIKAAEAKVKALTKPAWESFYKGAEEALGKDVYAAFYKKLPDWAKV